VAEYVEAKNSNSSSFDNGVSGTVGEFAATSGKAKTVSLGAILFF